MTTPRLVLPESYEDLIQEVQDEIAKLTQFVVPVEEAEQEIAVLAQSIRNSGKIVYLLGVSGIGKSTFIRSLTWRKFLPIPHIKEFNANELGNSNVLLSNLYTAIYEYTGIPQTGEQGLLTIVINYLEDFSGIPTESVKEFFRNINGLLRRKQILIIWPVTQQAEAESMVDIASSVSGTIFSDTPILQFHGPPIDRFPAIVQSTISTLNPGLSLDDFGLTEDGLDRILDQLKRKVERGRTIREYLKMVSREWLNNTNAISSIVARIPKFTEVWFVVSYPSAERIVSQFARKSPDPNLAWSADIKKFQEYVREGKKSNIWDAKRLMLALQGYFRVRILYLPTQALVSSVLAFGGHDKNVEEGRATSLIPKTLFDDLVMSVKNRRWRNESQAIRFLQTSPLFYQLNEQGMVFGDRRGKVTAQGDAVDAFNKINKHVRPNSEGSDQHINRCLVVGLNKVITRKDTSIAAEQYHPWLRDIRPDILVKPKEGNLICIEMYYTSDDSSHVLANYVLSKMDNYMRQLEGYLASPRLITDI